VVPDIKNRPADIATVSGAEVRRVTVWRAGRRVGSLAALFTVSAGAPADGPSVVIQLLRAQRPETQNGRQHEVAGRAERLRRKIQESKGHPSAARQAEKAPRKGKFAV
jgi:hypothetical protein